MKRLFFALLPLFVAGCSNGQLPEIPSVGVGGGGVHFVNDNAKDPYEAYDNAYGDLPKQHRRIKEGLEPQYRNRTEAEAALERIIRDLEIMQALLIKPEPKSLDGHIAFYKDALKDVQHDTYGGSFWTTLDQHRNDVRLAYTIEKVEIVAEFAKTDTKGQEKGAKEDPTAKVDPKDGPLPNPKERSDDPKKTTPKTSNEETKGDTDPSTAPALSFRLLYKAWARSHSDLVEAFASKKECGPLYEDVIAALKQMKSQVEKSRADKLQIYIGYYQSINEKTKGFTTLQDKDTQESIQNELKIVSSVIESMFHPDKK